MKDLISIRQICRRLRDSGYGDFLPKSVSYVVRNICGYKKQYGHYYHASAFSALFTDGNFKKLKDIDIRNRRIEKILGEEHPMRQSEDDIEMPIGYYKDMSKASQECVDKDEIDYARYNMFREDR